MMRRLWTIIAYFTLILATTLTSVPILAQPYSDMNSRSVDWLLDQVAYGEAFDKSDLVKDSLAKIFRIDPNNVNAIAAEARIHFAENNRREALASLNRLLALAPRSQEVQNLLVLKDVTGKNKNKFQLAMLAARAGRFGEAARSFKQLFNNQFPTLNLHLQYANWLSESETGWHQAGLEYQALLKQSPDSPRIKLAYANHLLRENIFSPYAFEVFRSLAHSTAVRSQIEYDWLNALSDLPVAEETLNGFAEYLRDFPFSSRGQTLRDNMQDDLVKLNKIRQSPYFQYWKQGEKYFQGKKYRKAQLFFKKALALKPEHAEILGSMGRALLADGQHWRAIHYFEKAANYANDPGDKTVWENLKITAEFWGLMRNFANQIDANQLTKAEKTLARADALNEDPVTVASRFGQLYIRKKQPQKALKLFRKVLAVEPSNTNGLAGMLEAYESISYEKAERYIASLTARHRKAINNPIKRYYVNKARTLAENHLKEGEAALAIKVLKAGIKKVPDHPWLNYDLADIYIDLDKPLHANSVFNKALWRFPLSSDLRYAYATFLSANQQNQNAYKQLKKIPIKKRDNRIIELISKLKFTADSQQVEQLIATNKPLKALDLLDKILTTSHLNADKKVDIAEYLYRLGQHKQAFALMLANMQTVEDKLLYASWLAETENAPELNLTLDEIPYSTLSKAQQQSYEQIKMAALKLTFTDPREYLTEVSKFLNRQT